MFYVNNLGVAMSEFEAVYKDYLKNARRAGQSGCQSQSVQWCSKANDSAIQLSKLNFLSKFKLSDWLFKLMTRFKLKTT